MILRVMAVAAVLGIVLIAGVPRVVALWPQQPETVAPPAIEVSASVQFFADGKKSSQRIVDTNSLVGSMRERLLRSEDDAEAVLIHGLLLFQQGDIDEAISQIRWVTEKAPRFELAHLILGDLLLSRVVPIETLGGRAVVDRQPQTRSKRLDELRSEARARLKGYLSLLNAQYIPQVLISLSEQTPYALVIDKSKNRLYVYQNTGSESPPLLMDDFYIVLGQKVGDKLVEGDLKTPTGTYFVTSYLASETLPSMYGSGAFPINYPNEYDRQQQKTGYGIWLHGTDRSLYSRPPLDSEGCVVLTNEEFVRIKQYITVGRTPVIISEKLLWLPPEQWLQQKRDIVLALEQWRQSWENTDLEAYLQMYASDFWTPQHNLASWKNYKQQVFAGKSFQQVELSDLSVLGYPRTDQSKQLVVANFVQHYRSNNYNGDMRKRLYLIKEEGQWRVLYEGHQ